MTFGSRSATAISHSSYRMLAAAYLDGRPTIGDRQPPEYNETVAPLAFRRLLTGPESIPYASLYISGVNRYSEVLRAPSGSGISPPMVSLRRPIIASIDSSMTESSASVTGSV